MDMKSALSRRIFFMLAIIFNTDDNNPFFQALNYNISFEPFPVFLMPLVPLFHSAKETVPIIFFYQK